MAMNQTQFMLDQMRRRFESDLSSWLMRVRSARRLEDAVRLGTQIPVPNSLLRGVPALVSARKAQAKREVEAELSRRLEAEPLAPEKEMQLYRMLCGAYPDLARRVDPRRAGRENSPQGGSNTMPN